MALYLFFTACLLTFISVSVQERRKFYSREFQGTEGNVYDMPNKLFMGPPKDSRHYERVRHIQNNKRILKQARKMSSRSESPVLNIVESSSELPYMGSVIGVRMSTEGPLFKKKMIVGFEQKMPSTKMQGPLAAQGKRNMRPSKQAMQTPDRILQMAMQMNGQTPFVSKAEGGQDPDPTKCCLPNSFSFLEVDELDQMSKNKFVLTWTITKTALDKTAGKIAMNQSIFKDGQEINKSIIIDANASMIYLIDRKQGCSISESTPPISWQLCLPAGVRYLVSYGVGAGTRNPGLRTDVYNLPMPPQYERAGGFYSATSGDCTPMGEYIDISKGKGDRIRQLTNFMNFTVGIADSSVFAVPPACPTAGGTGIREKLTFKVKATSPVTTKTNLSTAYIRQGKELF